jgi:hypothetical protein
VPDSRGACLRGDSLNSRVELVYDRDCPNISAARAILLRAFASIGSQPSWTEWDRRAPETPPYARAHGSPTILVEGRDVAAAAPATDADVCRVYPGADGSIQRVPSLEQVRAVLEAQPKSGSAYPKDPPRSSWGGLVAAVPGIGASFLPVGLCPACWPAYAGFLGSLGVGFLLDARNLFPLTVAFLALALASLGWRAPSRRGYRPFQVGLIGATLILAGKFLYSSDPVLYVGVTALFGATLWNAWPQRVTMARRCGACAPAGRPVTPRAHKHEVLL